MTNDQMECADLLRAFEDQHTATVDTIKTIEKHDLGVPGWLLVVKNQLSSMVAIHKERLESLR